MSVCLYVSGCLYVCLSVYLHIYLYTCLYVYLSIYLCIYLFVYLLISPSRSNLKLCCSRWNCYQASG